jgi:uracil-DNA glycosylase
MSRLETLLLPEFIDEALALAHPSWDATLRAGLHAMQHAHPDYFSDLAQSHYLPTENRLFAAFTLPVASVRYVLFGEGPYPRAESATGVCFMDGAVNSLWQRDSGLSKSVNRATSLRNFIKMLLVAQGSLSAHHTTMSSIKPIAELACKEDSVWVQTGAELQKNMMQHGFLLLNASLVFRKEVAPHQDAKAWLPFLKVVLQALAQTPHRLPTLILWGKIAEKIVNLPEASQFESAISEHPYNLTFITNSVMQTLFKPLNLLQSMRS